MTTPFITYGIYLYLSKSALEILNEMEFITILKVQAVYKRTVSVNSTCISFSLAQPAGDASANLQSKMKYKSILLTMC